MLTISDNTEDVRYTLIKVQSMIIEAKDTIIDTQNTIMSIQKILNNFQANRDSLPDIDLEKQNKKAENNVKSQEEVALSFLDPVLVIQALFFASFIGMLATVGAVQVTEQGTGWNGSQKQGRAVTKIGFSCVLTFLSLTIMLGRRLNLSKAERGSQIDRFSKSILWIFEIISRASLITAVGLFGNALVDLNLPVVGWCITAVAVSSLVYRLLDSILLGKRKFWRLFLFPTL